MKRSSAVILVLIALAANFAADRITKSIAIETLKDKPAISLLNDIVVLLYTENSGAFLNLGAGWPDPVKYAVLLVLPILACLAVLVWCIFKGRNRFVIVVAATIVAGGLGNLFDRLFNDFHVVDFLNFGIGNVRTGILNVADLSVTLGAATLLLYEIFRKKRTQVAVR